MPPQHPPQRVAGEWQACPMNPKTKKVPPKNTKD